MLEWAADPDPAVRRLATEGCRPRLPWGMRLHALVADPQPILPILERLHADPDESVRRSVANNLNDISRDHPDVVIVRFGVLEAATGHRHLPAGPPRPPDAAQEGTTRGPCRCWGSRPGCRWSSSELYAGPTGNPGSTAPPGSASAITSTLGETQPVMVDYAVHYVKAGGGTAPKVFRLGSVTMEPGQTVDYSRKLSFRQMTTRTHRAGTHRIDVLANGAVAGSMSFELATPE